MYHKSMLNGLSLGLEGTGAVRALPNIGNFIMRLGDIMI